MICSLQGPRGEPGSRGQDGRGGGAGGSPGSPPTPLFPPQGEGLHQLREALKILAERVLILETMIGQPWGGTGVPPSTMGLHYGKQQVPPSLSPVGTRVPPPRARGGTPQRTTEQLFDQGRPWRPSWIKGDLGDPQGPKENLELLLSQGEALVPLLDQGRPWRAS
uniref:EMI domain-containing protein n=1 Tax=Phasianus colchicus TaxID=9054 RepID=A0A669PBJ0_PHACC